MNAYEKRETILEIKGVSLSFGSKEKRVQILENVNAEVKDIVRNEVTPQGQIVGLLGPSGLGKTKLFEIMAGILRNDPDNHANVSGEVLVHGKHVKIGDVGVVQQNYPLFNHRTVYKNLMMAATPFHTQTESKAKVDEFLDILEMAQHGKKYPMQLSGGQRQRIAIAQQLLCNNDVLLMDEPFSGLDVLMIKKVSELILKVANMKETNTIIIVSHDVTSTAAISDTLWVLGRTKNPENNLPVTGAYIKHIYDLAAGGMAWRSDIQQDTTFLKMCSDIKLQYNTL